MRQKKSKSRRNLLSTVTGKADMYKSTQSLSSESNNNNALYMKSEDSLPQTSPYTSSICTLLIGDSHKQYTIQQELIRPFPKLLDNSTSSTSRFALYGLNEQSSLPEMSDHTAHTILHYLYTGSYQTLQSPQIIGSSQMVTEFGQIVDVYCAAVMYGIASLADIAKNKILELDKEVLTSEILTISREVFHRLPDHEVWFPEYVQEVVCVASRFEPELLLGESFLGLLGKHPAFDRALMKIFKENLAASHDKTPSMSSFSNDIGFSIAQEQLVQEDHSVSDDFTSHVEYVAPEKCPVPEVCPAQDEFSAQEERPMCETESRGIRDAGEISIARTSKKIKKKEKKEKKRREKTSSLAPLLQQLGPAANLSEIAISAGDRRASSTANGEIVRETSKRFTTALKIVHGLDVLEVLIYLRTATKTEIKAAASTTYERIVLSKEGSDPNWKPQIWAELISVQIDKSEVDLATYDVDDLTFLVETISSTNIPKFTIEISRSDLANC